MDRKGQIWQPTETERELFGIEADRVFPTDSLKEQLAAWDDENERQGERIADAFNEDRLPSDVLGGMRTAQDRLGKRQRAAAFIHDQLNFNEIGIDYTDHSEAASE